MSKLRILWMSDSPCFATGFGRVTREITGRLAKHPNLEIACVAWGHPTDRADAHDAPFKLYPSATSSCGQDVIENAVDDFKPHLVLSLGELRMVEWLSRHRVRDQFKWVAYVPLDGSPFYPPWTPVISAMSEVVAMSDFGQRVLQSGAPGKDVRRIYHGVDAETFKPLPNRAEIKNHPRLRDRFVVGFVGRNQPRKNIPALVSAFAILSKKYPDLHLYLHSTPSDAGWDLVHLLKRFQLEGRADLSSPNVTVASGLSDTQMNELYNLFDVMVLPTCAEGFGLPIIESLAAGVPVVATDFSACPELVRGHGELASVKTTVTTGWNLLDQAIVDVDDLAQCIEKLYLSPQLRRQYGQAGRAFAETLAWDRLVPQWFEVLSKVSGVDLRC